MNILIETPIECPYCGEPITILVDASIADQAYLEDCQVCCQPMVIRARVDEGDRCRVDARREEDG